MTCKAGHRVLHNQKIYAALTGHLSLLNQTCQAQLNPIQIQAQMMHLTSLPNLTGYYQFYFVFFEQFSVFIINAIIGNDVINKRQRA